MIVLATSISLVMRSSSKNALFASSTFSFNFSSPAIALIPRPLARISSIVEGVANGSSTSEGSAGNALPVTGLIPPAILSFAILSSSKVFMAI